MKTSSSQIKIREMMMPEIKMPELKISTPCRKFTATKQISTGRAA
jgi:hypothetical protein